MPAEVTGIVIGAGEILRIDPQSAGLNQLQEKLGVGLGRDIKIEIAIIFCQGVEAVRAGGDDLFDPIGFHQFDIFHGQALVQIFVTHFPHRLAAAFFFFAEDADRNACGLAELDETPGDSDISFVEGGITADEVEYIDFRILSQAFNPEACRPISPLGITDPERIAVHLGRLHGGHHFIAREFPCHQDHRPAQLDYFTHMLDCRGTDLLTGPAGGAGPEHIPADKVDEVGIGLGKSGLAQLIDHLHRRQRLAGGPGRTTVLAAFAEGAGVGIEDILPGHLLEAGRAEALGLFIFQVEIDELALRPEIGEQKIRTGRQDMPEFGEWNDDKKSHHQQKMKPPGNLVHCPQAALAHPGKKIGRHQTDRRPRGQGRAEFNHRHTATLDDESGNEDGKQQPVHDRIVTLRFQPLRRKEIAAHQKAAQHHDADQAGQIESDREQFVEGSLEKFYIKQQIGEIGLDDDQGGPDYEENESPEKQAVQQTGPPDPDHFFLQQDIFQHKADAPLQLIRPVQRQSLLIHGHPLQKSPYQQTNRDNCEEVHGNQRRGAMTDIPVNFSGKFHCFLQLLFLVLVV
ncbi:MAG: hypothetical protein ACD_75C01311G0001 [uncultured bacterium]|nr:MAG: hypothetical protein ACD_75C01311G0001 [uncultured bacterium]